MNYDVCYSVFQLIFFIWCLHHITHNFPKKKQKTCVCHVDLCVTCTPSHHTFFIINTSLCVWREVWHMNDFFLCIGIVSISDPRTMLEPVIFKSTKIKCKYMSVIETVWIFIKSNTDWWSFRPVSSYSKLLVFSDSRHEVERM